MMPETQVHTIARQMLEKHGMAAIAQAARNAVECERKGDPEFKKVVEVGRSLAADRRSKAGTVAKPGQGDKGDQRKR